MKATVERNFWLGEMVIVVTTVVLVIIIIMSILELFLYVLTQKTNGQLECMPEYCDRRNKCKQDKTKSK
jgi:hypothetical protein